MGMTREIALHCMKSASELERELCEECPIYGQTGSDHCFEDALQYVIGMLEQEPKIVPIAEIKFDKDELKELVDKAVLTIAPPEPKIGHWILTNDDFVYCSECEDSYYPRPIDASWYYCPHCGAKMDKEHNNEID